LFVEAIVDWRRGSLRRDDAANGVALGKNNAAVIDFRHRMQLGCGQF
jgi:hypothetical protein